MVSSKIKKVSIIAGILVLAAGLTVGGIMFVKSRQSGAKAGEVGTVFQQSGNATGVGIKAEMSESYGYQALKVAGEFVDKKLFQDERSKLYLNIEKQSELMRVSEEELDDMVLLKVIDKVVTNIFLLKKSDEQVTEAEIDEYINDYIKARYKTEEEYNAFLATSSYDSEDELREVSKLFLLKLKVMPKICSEYGITVDDTQVNESYERFKDVNTEYTFRHIYISNKTRSENEASELAESIYKQLSEGADIKELAKKYSDDEGTKNNGGLNEHVVLEDINEELKSAYVNAGKGDLIPPLKITGGYYVALVEDRGDYYPDIETFKKNLLITAFVNSGKYDEWFEKVKSEEAIEIVDTRMRAYREFASGEYLKAAQDYEAVYEEDKDYVNLEKAAESYGMLESWEETIRVCDRGISVKSSVPTFYTYKGVSLYKMNEKREGLKLLKKAEELAGKNFNSLAMVESAYKDLGLEGDAARINKKYYETD